MKKSRNIQKKFQCDFCSTRNSWVKLIKVRDSKHLMCPECIAELARQCKIEKEKNDAAKLQANLHRPESGAGADSNRGIGSQSTQTENSQIEG